MVFIVGRVSAKDFVRPVRIFCGVQLGISHSSENSSHEQNSRVWKILEETRPFVAKRSSFCSLLTGFEVVESRLDNPQEDVGDRWVCVILGQGMRDGTVKALLTPNKAFAIGKSACAKLRIYSDQALRVALQCQRFDLLSHSMKDWSADMAIVSRNTLCEQGLSALR